MSIQWNNPQRFSFGSLDAAQQALDESNPDVAYQQLMNWYGKGDPNFASTTLGRYIASQQSSLNNDYLKQSSDQQANWASQKATWDTQQASNKTTWDTQQQANLADYNQKVYLQRWLYGQAKANNDQGNMARTNAQLMDLQNNPYKVQDYQTQAWNNPDAANQLTWTKYLENSNAGQGGLANNFGLLSSAQRGANPGSFEVRRNIW